MVPTSRESLVEYVKHYLGKLPTSSVAVGGFSVSGKAVVNLTTGAIYVYNPNFCGVYARQFNCTCNVNINGKSYYIENPALYVFGFNCHFNQSIQVIERTYMYGSWYLVSTENYTYSPAALDLRTSFGITGNVYIPSPGASCNSTLIATHEGPSLYRDSGTVYYKYIVVKIGNLTYMPVDIKVYGVNPSCPPLSYSSGRVLIQFPGSTLAINVTAAQGYLVTRSLSWAFQAVAIVGRGSDLIVHSGNNTVALKNYLASCGSVDISWPTSSSQYCYEKYDGPYDVSWYPTGPNKYQAYGTFIVYRICGDQIYRARTERLALELTLKGQVVSIQDPKNNNQICGPDKMRVDEEGKYIGCQKQPQK